MLIVPFKPMSRESHHNVKSTERANLGGFAAADIKIYKASVTKSVHYWCRDRPINQRNRIEIPKLRYIGMLH